MTYISIFAICILVFQTVYGQWKQIDGFCGGYFVDIGFGENGTVFAATTSSIYKSADNGLNWSIVDTVTGITALAADGDTFYAGVSTQVHISTDGGVHWEKCARFTETAHGQITGIFIKENKIMVSTVL